MKAKKCNAKKFVLHLSYLLVMLALISAPALATDVRGRIDSRNQANGYFQPVAGALVELLYPNGSIAASTTTSYDGFYYFYGVNPGQYTLSVNRSPRTSVFIPNQPGFDIPPVLL